LDGFVQKDVGEATHYHTQWIMPWWAPSVSKVAQVGTQIFYRWPGQLGMPSAFNGRYAGNEHVGKGAQVAADGEAVASTTADGRVHALVAVASAAPVIDAAPAAQAVVAPSLEIATVKLDAPEVKLQPARPWRSRSDTSLFSTCVGGPCLRW